MKNPCCSTEKCFVASLGGPSQGVLQVRKVTERKFLEFRNNMLRVVMKSDSRVVLLSRVGERVEEREEDGSEFIFFKHARSEKLQNKSSPNFSNSRPELRSELCSFRILLRTTRPSTGQKNTADPKIGQKRQKTRQKKRILALFGLVFVTLNMIENRGSVGGRRVLKNSPQSCGPFWNSLRIFSGYF